MKSVSFFSSKGGVGKSIHTIMFASYLSYVKGKKVLVVDLDHPVARVSATRESELRQLYKPGSGLSVYFNRVGKPSGVYDIRSFVREGEDSNPNFTKVVANRLKTFLLSSEGKQYDYVLIDLDASIGKNSLAFYIISGGACDMVFIPTNTELMNRQAAFYTAELCRLWEQPFHLFWNNVSSMQIAREGYLK